MAHYQATTNAGRLDKKMSKITIATSIVPRNFETQRVAINSWLHLGFKVISLNSAEEAAIVAQNFPDIPIKIVNRTAESTTGRPYVFFDDVCSAMSEVQTEICGIVNSDILFRAGSDFIDFIVETVSDGLLFGARIDVGSMSNFDGEKFIYGFDYFFFSKRVLKVFPESGFCLGVPWWDYWAPFVPLVKGFPCKELISPVAFHLWHETKWASRLFYDYGKMFAEKISQVTPSFDFDNKMANVNSPGQLTVFSLDVLQYILNNSNKVVYPRSDDGNIRIEVGQSQYLAMRAQIIEYRKRTIELHDQIEVANININPCASEIEAIRSSLSWRLTKPLRWLGDWVRRQP